MRTELERLEDLDDDATNEFEELSEKLAALEQPPRVYTPEQMAMSGAMVGVDHSGGWSCTLVWPVLAIKCRPRT